MSHKVAIKYIGHVVIYKLIDPHNYSLMTLDSKILERTFRAQEIKALLL